MLRFLTLLSLVVLSVRLYLMEVFSPTFITIALVAAVVALALGRRGYIVAASNGGLRLLAQFVSSSDAALRGQFIQSVLTLVLVLAGFNHPGREIQEANTVNEPRKTRHNRMLHLHERYEGTVRSIRNRGKPHASECCDPVR